VAEGDVGFQGVVLEINLDTGLAHSIRRVEVREED